jgi:hypothetical protein
LAHYPAATMKCLLVSDLHYTLKQFDWLHAVADFDVESRQFAILEPLAMTYSHDFTLLRFLLGRIGDDDSVARGFLFLDPLDYDVVV